MSEDSMPLTSHLEDLRKRVMHSLLYLMAGFGVCYGFREPLVNLIKLPMNAHIQIGTSRPFLTVIRQESPYQLYFLSPAEAFWMYLKTAFLAGLCLVLPLVLWEVWKFVAPGLLEKERKYAIPFVVISTLMFYIGLAFCFLIILPYAMEFLLGFSQNLVPMISVGNYVDFCLKFLISFGLVFELPLVILVLTRMGIVTPATLARQRKFAVLGAFILAAFLTPTPDAFNQTLMALPIIILYEAGILASRILWRGDKDG